MKTIVVDVRTQKEFQEGSYPGAINLPVNTFDSNEYEPFKNDVISLVCFSGNRAGKVKSKLNELGFSNVSVMDQQIVQVDEGAKKNTGVWTIDRQFRLSLGILIGAFLIGNYVFHSTWIVAILIIVFSGLIYSAISDNCYLKMLIALLPWNKRLTKISQT